METPVNLRTRAVSSAIALLLAAAGGAQAQSAPHLRRQGSALQLIVDDKPFLILGGELANSSASSLEYLKPAWARFARMNMNTVLAPVSWELIEPEEGRFDFSTVDGLLADARAANQRLVLLWFGSWKNSMSSYAPGWVKRDEKRFPRTRVAGGHGSEIISPLSQNALKADSAAFSALMAHLKAVDGDKHTVLMVQVENEMGMLPTARDQSPAADAAFAKPVPKALMGYLAAHRAELQHELKALWEANGAKTEGDWKTVFGPGPAGEEAFTAWTLARYADAVTRAGKAAYDLPMYFNVALNRPGKAPGEGYPSGGPLPHLIDVWKAGAPAADFIAPDIYFPNFGEIVARYRRADNPLFVPEANRAGRLQSPSEAFLAVGGYDAIGVSPFSIDAVDGPAMEPIAETYAALRELSPLILAAQGSGRMTGFAPAVSFNGTVQDEPKTVPLGGYELTAHFVDPWVPKADQKTETHGAIVIQLGPDEYLMAGSGVTFTFAPATPGPAVAGVESIWEGRYVDGKWVPGRLLNGDESHQGRHLRLPPGPIVIQRVKLYRYD
jgi:beta-galactosidase GanA